MTVQPLRSVWFSERLGRQTDIRFHIAAQQYGIFARVGLWIMMTFFLTMVNFGLPE